MNSQLSELQASLRANADRVRSLAAKAGEPGMAARPKTEAWSAAECLAHLTLSTEGFLPSIRSAITEARKGNLNAHGQFRLDMLGRILTWALEPPPRFKVKAPPALRPVTSGDEAAKFLASQDQLLQLVSESDGLALDRMKVPSPAAANLRYSVWSAFHVTAAHQRRHLWQAERAAGISQ